MAAPGTGWGGTDIENPLSIIDRFDAKYAKPGLTMLMVSTTGEQADYFVLDDDLAPRPARMPAPLARSIELIRENCEPALCTVMFMAGAGGSLRAGGDGKSGSPDPQCEGGADPCERRAVRKFMCGRAAVLL